MLATVSARWFLLRPSYMHRLSLASRALSGRRGLRILLRLSVFALAVVAGFFATPAAALSLGNADVVSYLGQPLHMRIPVVLDEPGDVAQQCVRIINQP